MNKSEDNVKSGKTVHTTRLVSLLQVRRREISVCKGCVLGFF